MNLFSYVIAGILLFSIFFMQAPNFIQYLYLRLFEDKQREYRKMSDESCIKINGKIIKCDIVGCNKNACYVMNKQARCQKHRPE